METETTNTIFGFSSEEWAALEAEAILEESLKSEAELEAELAGWFGF
jgi:hypothetical protein